MLTLDLMLLVLAQSAVSAPAQGASPALGPNVEVVAPTQQRRTICRTVTPSGSHIAARRICQTVAQIEEARDRMQDESDRDVRSTMRRTNEMVENSGYGNWVRSRTETPVGTTDARPVQQCRIRMGAAGC